MVTSARMRRRRLRALISNQVTQHRGADFDLVDIDELLRQFAAKDPEFWDQLLARAEELGLERAAYYGLRYARQLIGSPIPDSVTDATNGWGPVAPERWLMDRLMPQALYPPHPDFRSRRMEFSRQLLYIRSHWIRMPPWLLSRV